MSYSTQGGRQNHLIAKESCCWWIYDGQAQSSSNQIVHKDYKSEVIACGGFYLKHASKLQFVLTAKTSCFSSPKKEPRE
ncbi:hypothetical protein PVAP13_9NG266573 [Panicum virgatum]|uniref:Uncharacterized protein n=1 Tax=Panicum virgatum TaxID=38727 RepID=A0A8T0MK68_PANVG|nr:hypothetical protein PVAP13_9NG266573 [Panicum virgatum]